MFSAEGLGFDGPGVFHPAKVINMMDVEVAETAAAGPEKTMEALNLPEQFRWRPRPLGGERGTERSVHAIPAHQHDVTNLAVLNAFVQFLHRPAVTGHQADPHLQVLRRRLLGELEHPA